MNFKREITPKIVIADQPTEDDLRELKAQGYDAVLNLRNNGEPEQPIDTVAEGELVRSLGLDYHHTGIGGAPLNPDLMVSASEFIAAHGKVLVHCRKGGRAAAMVLIQQARANGWTPEEAFEKGKAMGLDVEGGLRLVVDQYLRMHAR